MSEEGLLLADKSTALPLKKVCVDAEVKGYLLGLQASLVYQNDSTDPVEVLFRMPLERSHAVVGLTALLDGKKITAQLQDKQEARDKYEDAIATGKTAALGEEKTGDIFSISLGNLRGGGEAEIQLKMVGELPIDAEGGVRFSLPTTLKPRYTPAGSTDPLAPVEGEDGQVEQGKIKGVHQFELTVFDAEEVSSVVSPTHSIAISREDTQIKVTLSESIALHNDLVVLIAHKEPHKPRALVERGLPIKEGETAGFLNHLAVMVNFFPDIPPKDSQNEFIFLVDRSGSMNGSFIRSASDALVLFLKSLPEDCRFNIYGFGSTFESLFPSSVPYTQQNLDTATQHAQGLKADLGGTELLPPLNNIFQQPLIAGLDRQIFVLTDGAVSNTSACVDEVKKNADSARCFTFGIGSGASTELVEGLARAGQGSAEFVKEDERLQPKVVRSLKHAMQASAKNVTVIYTLPEGFSVQQAPTNLKPLFGGEKLVLYGIIESKDGDTTKLSNVSGEVELKATIAGNETSWKMAFDAGNAPASQPNIFAAFHLAAKTLLEEMELEGKPKKEIVKLSVDSHVVSSATAFVAVDETTQEPVQGAMKVYDLQLNEGLDSLRYNVQMAQSSMATNIDSILDRGDSFLNLEASSENLSDSAACFSKGSRRRRRRSSVGKATVSVGSALGSAASRMGSAMSSWFRRRSPDDDSSVQRPEHLNVKSEENEEDDEFAHVSPMSVTDDIADPEDDSKPHPLSNVVRTPLGPSLSSLIALQLANGSWSLTGALCSELGKELKVVEDSCPSGCPSAVWATALALSSLKLTYSSQQDEWELVAKKAEAWLKKQSLPADLHSKAIEFLK